MRKNRNDNDIEQPSEGNLKLATARTIKWNTIDRVGTQLLYAIVGVVLANILTKEEFGLVGALLVFQAFAIIFVDSGFGAALLRLKNPTQRDYSTVFWFNLIVSILIYIILFFGAPLISDIFQGNRELIPLSKVMFLTFVLNGLAIVQTNRLMKQMNVRQIAVSNVIGLTTSGVVAIILALKGYGAWALVWQSVTLSAVKTLWLWITGHWLPSSFISKKSFRRIWRIGLSVFSSSFLNTLSQNIYSFIIGAFYNLTSLGVYTQADKWSKMGSASISQIITSSFVPLMSRAQDDADLFHRYMCKVNRFTAFILFPVMGGIIMMGTPLFHTLFGNKWDQAIPLFQILTGRGIFIVLISLYTNYMLALGYGKRLLGSEIVKDVFILGAILITIPFKSVEILVWGQAAATFVTYYLIMRIICLCSGYSVRDMLGDLLPFMLLTGVACAGAWIVLQIKLIPILSLLAVAASGAVIYIGGAYLIKLPELTEAFNYACGRFIHK